MHARHGIIGYGDFTYKRANGDIYQFMATGFSPRACGIAVYILAGLDLAGSALKNLAPHKKTNGCLYLKKVTELNMNALDKVIKHGIRNLKFKFDLIEQTV